MTHLHPRITITLAGIAGLTLALAFPAVSRAEGSDTGAGGSVARVSVIRGTVTLQHGENGSPVPATMNAPVLPGDYVSTRGDSRAEIELDATSTLRLAADVQLRFTRLDANERELQLAEGTLELRVLRTDAAPVQVDTPSIAVRPDVAGGYRITVDAAGRTQVTVRSGRAQAIAANETRVLLPGTTLYAEGPASDPVLRSGSAIALDAFDRFNTERDGPELRALSDAYAPPGVAGIADLQTYGHWISDPAYGMVWTPYSVAAGWAPYRDGAWNWYAPYGWTWVGYEPWGWAPYHYGRWYYNPHRGWCWVPARAAIAWSPALVNFVTFGGPRLGTIGWVPLAPFQPFTPWWGQNGYNVVTNARYVGRNAPYGATAIAKQRFLEGRGSVTAVTSASTAWTRFSATRPAAIHAVQVIDGGKSGAAAVQRTTGVWSRFDGSAGVRPQTTLPAATRAARAPVTAPARELPAARTEYRPAAASAPAQYAPAHHVSAGEGRPVHNATHEHSASSTTHHKP